MKKRIQDQQFQIDLLKTQLEVISLLLRIQNFKAEIIVPNIGSIIVRFSLSLLPVYLLKTV